MCVCVCVCVWWRGPHSTVVVSGQNFPSDRKDLGECLRGVGGKVTRVGNLWVLSASSVHELLNPYINLVILQISKVKLREAQGLPQL